MLRVKAEMAAYADALTCEPGGACCPTGEPKTLRPGPKR